MRSKSQILSKLRADGHITDEEYKMLEQEPCEDAISRQAALRQAINAYKMAQENEFDFKDICEEYLNVLPPVISHPKVGRWIEERTYMKCSNCHDIWHYEENQTERFKFCPTCGERIKQ